MNIDNLNCNQIKPTMQELEKLNNITTQTRRDILRMVHKVNSGHPGGSLGCTRTTCSQSNR